MLFNSYPFLGVFLPIVLAGFFALRWQVARLVWIVVASYVFYGYAKAWFPALMGGSTVISFTTGFTASGETAEQRMSSSQVWFQPRMRFCAVLQGSRIVSS